jgi:hypothetical protein
VEYLKMSKSIVVYYGPSRYDGSDIVAILQPASRNIKTGSMVQLWIMRADTAPIEASRKGLDYAVCGNCKHRGTPNPDKASGWAEGRTCYINLLQAPSALYNAWKRGSIKPAKSIGQVQAMLSGQGLRVGAYGDPAALPDGLVTMLCNMAEFHTSYTHGHTVSDTLGDSAASYSMVSADSEAEAIQSHEKGFRTFRVIPIAQANKPLLKNEIMCPNTTKGIQCNDCRLCNGNKYNGKSIAIIAHGMSKNKIQ